MFEYHKFTVGATDRQKKMISTFHKPKRAKRTGTSFDKKKYWCPIKKDWYVKTSHHTHCVLCYDDLKDDLHEIVEYDPKIHKEEDD